MNRIIESIEKELLSWPYVTAEPHIFGGIEFRINKGKWDKFIISYW